MNDMRKIDWFVELEEFFNEKGGAGEDFFYIIRTMLIEQRVSFSEMILSAVQGHGIRVHEGLEFILDEDLEDPSDFDGVIFVIGEFESSVLPIIDFVDLLELSCQNYINYFKDDKDRISSNLGLIKAKYLDGSV